MLYGPQARPPDLTLAMQFLIDDLRFDGRKVSWIALKGPSLRLRVEGYELVLAHTDGALPAQAFHGVLRPAPNARQLAQHPDDDAAAPDSADLARGRVLYALRHHPCALSVLLRPRGAAPAGWESAEEGLSEAADPALLALVRECRALLEPVIEAAAPATVIWQPGAVAFTCEEFLASRAEALLLPGDTARPLQLAAEGERPRHRPLLTDFPLPADQPATLPACLPQTRAERASQRSAGQLFGRTRATGRAAALPRLHRQDARLARAMRAAPPVAEEAAEKARRRRLNLARAANLATLALWYALLVPPLAGML